MRPSSTIIADASLDPHTGAGGWAAWMIGNGRPSTVFGGRLRQSAKSSTEAELMALANALHMAVSRGYAERGVLVMIQSDSIDALGHIRQHMGWVRDMPHPDGLRTPIRKGRPRHEAGRRAIKAIAKLSSKNALDLAVRHVKGHTDGAGRHWCNATCDELARRHMREARDALREIAEPDALLPCVAL